MPYCSTAEKFSSAWLLSWCWVLFWCIWTIHIYLWLFLIQVTWTTVRQGFSGSVQTQLCISDQCQLCSLAQAGPKTWNGSWGLDVGSVLVPADGEPLPSALGSQEEVVGWSCSSLHAGALIQAPLQEHMGTRGTDAPAHLDLLKPNAYFPIQISLETVKSPGSAERGRKALSEEGGGCHLWCLLLPREFALNSFQHNPPNYVIFVPEELCCFYGVPKILSIFPLI